MTLNITGPAKTYNILFVDAGNINNDAIFTRFKSFNNHDNSFIKDAQIVFDSDKDFQSRK